MIGCTGGTTGSIWVFVSASTDVRTDGVDNCDLTADGPDALLEGVAPSVGDVELDIIFCAADLFDVGLASTLVTDALVVDTAVLFEFVMGEVLDGAVTGVDLLEVIAALFCATEVLLVGVIVVLLAGETEGLLTGVI